MKTIERMASLALLVVAGAGCVTEEHAGYWPPPHPGLPPSHRPLPPPHVVVVLTADERQIVERYVKSCEAEERQQKHGKRKGWKGRGLPPGLAKKVDQGRGLPPGWERGSVKGSVMPVEVYQQCHSLPSE